MSDNVVIRDICGKRTIDHVIDCISEFNIGNNTVLLRAVGGNTSKAIDVAHILSTEFQVKIDKCMISTMKIKGTVISSLMITLKCDFLRPCKPGTNRYHQEKFVPYPVYNLVLEWHLAKGKEIQFASKEGSPLLSVTKKDGKYAFHRKIKLPMNEFERKEYELYKTSMYRAGLFFPPNWAEFARKISEYDDVIIGIDTNILYAGSVNEHLLPALSLIEPREFTHTPNWILFVIPSAVMHELEEAANIRSKGLLDAPGRKAFRALQDIVEISQSVDMHGMSLIIVGQANPMFETKLEIKNLRYDIYNHMKNRAQGDENVYDPKSNKSSSGDMIIRDQFKNFIKQIEFHKGVFFITADKTNAALAQTEGLHPLYVKMPDNFESEEFEQFKYTTEDKKDIVFSVPMGKLLYELVVQFGAIRVKVGETEISVGCDTKGEKLDNWLNKELFIKRDDMDVLMGDYIGHLNWDIILRSWNKIQENLSISV